VLPKLHVPFTRLAQFGRFRLDRAHRNGFATGKLAAITGAAIIASSQGKAFGTEETEARCCFRAVLLQL
jgi:hypothetical protein